MVSKDSSSRIDWKRWFWTNGPYAGSLNFVAKSPKAAAEEKVSKKTEKLHFFGFCSNLYDNEIGMLCRPIYFHMLFADSSKSLNPLWKYTKNEEKYLKKITESCALGFCTELQLLNCSKLQVYREISSIPAISSFYFYFCCFMSMSNSSMSRNAASTLVQWWIGMQFGLFLGCILAPCASVTAQFYCSLTL